MKIITKPLELKEYLSAQCKTVGFVPTMGALHEGHVSLIRNAKKDNELVVVSIFVNPTQFLKGEDLDKYPSRHEADTKICSISGVDVLFLPNREDMYGSDEATLQAPKVRGYVLEGATRPGHFSGVLTVVMKLLNIVNPSKAYFGKKDAQQLNLVTLMVKQLFMSVEIVPVNTVRESDGLALSSRNMYLSASERKDALKISKSLHLASRMIMENSLNVEEIKLKMREILAPLEVSYVEILNRDFEVIQKVEIAKSVVLVEAMVGNTRLLDNIWV